jgi:hypothetical protein
VKELRLKEKIVRRSRGRNGRVVMALVAFAHFAGEHQQHGRGHRGGPGEPAPRAPGDACSPPGCDRRDKPVALSRDGLDEPRLLCIVAQSSTQVADAVVQPPVEIHVGRVSPDCVAQLFTRHEIAGAHDDGGQDECGLRLQRDSQAILPELSGSRVKFERSECASDLVHATLDERSCRRFERFAGDLSVDFFNLFNRVNVKDVNTVWGGIDMRFPRRRSSASARRATSSTRGKCRSA